MCNWLGEGHGSSGSGAFLHAPQEPHSSMAIPTLVDTDVTMHMVLLVVAGV
jgi:hypothetical protein